MSSLTPLDPLYCQEDNSDLEEHKSTTMTQFSGDPLAGHHLFLAAKQCTTQTLSSLITKQIETNAGDESGHYLTSERKEAVKWMLSATGRHELSVITIVLAVNYLDRCFLPAAGTGVVLKLQSDKPWMGRLAAVACLSLATKIDETYAPLSIELQDNGHAFYWTTVRHMELLVLSMLSWWMNSVTVLSFIDEIILGLCLNAIDGREVDDAAEIGKFVRACELALLSVAVVAVGFEKEKRENTGGEHE